MCKEKRLALESIILAMEDIRNKIVATDNDSTLKIGALIDKYERLVKNFIDIKRL